MTREIMTCPHCGGAVRPRDYDMPEAIAKRLDFFEQKTLPVIEAYRQENKLIAVDGEQEVADVFEEIRKQLRPFMRKTSIDS